MVERRFDAASFWSLLEEEDRAVLYRASMVRVVEGGDVIVAQNDTSDYLLVILSGCVKVLRDSASGYRAVLALRGPGDLLGEQAGIDGRNRSATLLAVMPGQVLILTLDRFRQLAARRPGITKARDKVLSGRLREADGQRLSVSEPVAPRLAALLLELGDRFGRPGPRPGQVRIELPLSQGDLAGLVLSSLRTVTRVLEQWRDQEWVLTGRQSLQLLAVDHLRTVAAGRYRLAVPRRGHPAPAAPVRAESGLSAEESGGPAPIHGASPNPACGHRAISVRSLS